MHNWIGFIAALLTTASFFPQIYKTLRSRSTQDISWGWVSMMLGGVFCWLIYGVLLKSSPIIIANGITFFALLILFIAKLKFEIFHKNL